MSRPQNESYELTDAEKRDLIALIQAGKPLPEKYRFLLFEDKREVELVWNGKSREVCNAVLPFQTLEHIDEPRREKKQDEELALDMGGRQVKGWTNKLIWGDNLLVTSSLLEKFAGKIDLIYIDPPFGTGTDFSQKYLVDSEELHALMMVMIGQLNASHTGVSGGPSPIQRTQQTRYPGFSLVSDASGFYKVGHIYKDGPADRDYLKIKEGHYVLAVDDHDIKSGDNYWRFFTLAPGTKFHFLINDKPVSNDALFKELESALADAREKLVILRGDKKVLLGQAVNILDLAQQAGARGIALATKPPPKQG